MKLDQLAPKHHEVALDYFLFSCFEFENLCKAVPSKLRDENRWLVNYPMEATPEDPTTLTDMQPLRERFSEITSWYRNKFPKLGRGFDIDYENLSEIIPAVVMMTIDLDEVAKAMSGAPIPLVDRASEDPGPIWHLIRNVIDRGFPEHADYILNYFEWKKAQVTEEVIVPGSRPPVGRNSPFFRPGRTDGPGSRGRGGPRRSGGGPGGPSSSRPPRSQSSSRPPRRDHDDQRGPRHAAHGNHGNHDNHGNHGDRPPGRGRGDRPQGSHRPGGARKERDPKLEGDSLREVQVAVEGLNTDTTLTQFRLPPANSYYRRLQHEQIRKEGLYSISDGEGTDRAVIILRDQPEDYEGHE
jgi:hypothetical protein